MSNIGKKPKIMKNQFKPGLNSPGNDITDPVELLRVLQSYIVQGRELEPSESSDLIEGKTNFIYINRMDVLNSAIDEIKTIKDPRITLEVNFYRELAEDTGVPRREFFRLAMQAAKEKYIDHGWRNHLSEDYEVVGLFMALSILQNRVIPCYFAKEHLQEMFNNSDTEQICILKMKKGLDKLGLVTAIKAFPQLLYLFHYSSSNLLTYRQLIHLLKPDSSEEGSNAHTVENQVYGAFGKYAREEDTGNRHGVNLETILESATGTYEEPPLGFSKALSMIFVEADANLKWSFLPIANTCINQVIMPRPSTTIQLLNEAELFEVYDNTFLSKHFRKP